MGNFNSKKFVVVASKLPEPSAGNSRSRAVDGTLIYKGLVDGRRVYFIEPGQGYKVSLLWGNHITPVYGAKIIDASGVSGQKERINLITHRDFAVVRINDKFLGCDDKIWIPVQKEALICYGLLPLPAVEQDFTPPSISNEEFSLLGKAFNVERIVLMPAGASY